MGNYLEKFSDEQLQKRRENIYYLTCWLYTSDDEQDKRRHDDMLELLKETDAEIERRSNVTVSFDTEV